MPTKKRCPFELRNFVIQQENVSLPVTTDACIFGSLTEFESPDTILDVGCGSGVLMFLMHQKYPNAHILGIEKHIESVACVQDNIALNHCEDYLRVQESDWWQFKPERLVNAIICNPPFFSKQLPSQELAKRNARHTEHYELWQLLEHMCQWLTPNGQITLLIPAMPPEHIERDWLTNFTNPLYQVDHRSIQSFEGSQPHVSIVQFAKTPKPFRPQKPLVIYSQKGCFTTEIKAILGPYLQDRALK